MTYQLINFLVRYGHSGFKESECQQMSVVPVTVHKQTLPMLSVWVELKNSQ